MRFLLTVAPEDHDAMATRQQPDRKAKYKEKSADSEEIVVQPADSADEACRLASAANHWGENELRLLRVSYPLNRPMNLNDVLQVDESAWSEDMRRRRI